MSNNNTAVTNTNLPPPGTGAAKLSACEVGPFRLPGVRIDLNQFTTEQVADMRVWAEENGAYGDADTGIFSWRDKGKRDWFILRWS